MNVALCATLDTQPTRPTRFLSAKYSRRIEYDKRHFLVIKKKKKNYTRTRVGSCVLSSRLVKKDTRCLSRDMKAGLIFSPCLFSSPYSLFLRNSRNRLSAST